MRMPGFTAEASFSDPQHSYRARPTQSRPAQSAIEMQTMSLGSFGGFGGFGPTLPSCHWEKQWVVCGSALPGYDPPMCLEWVYVCKFPGSSRGLMM